MQHVAFTDVGYGINNDRSNMINGQSLTKAVWTDLDPQSVAKFICFSLIQEADSAFDFAPICSIDIVLLLSEEKQISLKLIHRIVAK